MFRLLDIRVGTTDYVNRRRSVNYSSLETQILLHSDCEIKTHLQQNIVSKV